MIANGTTISVTLPLPLDFRGVQFTVAKKNDLIAGSNSVEFMQSDSNLNYFSLHPVETPSPTSTLLITTVGDFDHNTLQVLYIDGPLSNLHISFVSTPIQTNHVPPDGIQTTATLYVPGTTQQTKEITLALEILVYKALFGTGVLYGLPLTMHVM